MNKRENITAGEILLMIREQIIMSTDMNACDELSEAFKGIFRQIQYLERCYDAEHPQDQ